MATEQLQPPADLLARMIPLRVHRDDRGGSNGVEKVLPGSPWHGWLDDERDEWKPLIPVVRVHVRADDIVTMCPLILQSSSRATVPTHRRAIHIEYASFELSGRLDWNRRVGLPNRSGIVPAVAPD